MEETGGHASRVIEVVWNTRLGWRSDSSITPAGPQTQSPMDQSILQCVREHKFNGMRPYGLAYKVATAELILVVASTTDATVEH